MQNTRPLAGLDDDVGRDSPPFLRAVDPRDPSLPHIYLSESKGSLARPPYTFSPLFREPNYYPAPTSDNMSDAPSSSTPRLSDISSVDSPRTSLDHAPPNGQHGHTKNGHGYVGSDEAKVRASPESDAVASSDEESEQNKLLFAQNKNSAVSQFSSRRPSYAAEFQTRQRTYSSSGPLSPTSSHPAGPSGDTAAWAAGVSATATAGMSSGTGAGQPLGPFWGSMSGSIWNSEPSRKSPPNPLSVQSSGLGPNNPSPLFNGIEALPSPTSMPPNNGEFPLPIPPQPLHRNYRSMSFSVGQMDLEDHARPRLSPPTGMGGSKHPPPSGLQHRPSRPSLLSGEQYPGEPTPLRSVSEMEDDEEAATNDLSKSNSLYLQQQQANFIRSRYENLRMRNRSASATTIPTMNPNGVLGSSMLGNRDGDRIDEYESAIGEDDDMDFTQFQAEQRRFSEAPRSMSLMYSPAENQRLETLRRQHWASAGSPLGYPDPGTQSRRHSFAGRLPNDSGEGDYNVGASDLLSRRNSTLADSGLGALGGRDSLYLTDDARLRAARHSIATVKQSGLVPPSGLEQHLQQLPSYASSGRMHQPSPPPGPTRSMGGMPTHHVQQPRAQQLLYFVTFKACRGDVFFVQEGTGLRVRVGDLVIVEADRGTDLGTVVAEQVTWQKAKELKEHYAKEQYNVLMMYASRRATAAGAPPGGLHNGASGSFSSGPGGMSGHGQPQGQDSSSGELKPKMIKRLAQPHEIQTLRDKEANEAKAKRVCQQKVLEHRLPMEILDAEFQMDWKKLTFYYFADSYINFNSLVTDLFKVYKTRIWMSAMNPASFAHPTTGLHPPGSGIGPSTTLGAIGELPNDGIHSPYGLGSSYGNYGNTNGSANSLMGAGQRGPSQQNGLHLGLYQSQHSPHSSLAPQEFNNLAQQNTGYGPSYLNGASGLSGQSPYTNGEAHGVNSALDAPWMGLQGLSLNSH